MLKSLVFSSSVVLLFLSPSFAGENQEKLRSLKVEITEMYDSTKSNLPNSPYSYDRPLGSRQLFSDAQGLLDTIPVEDPSINLRNFPGLEDVNRVVDAEALAELLIPVAEALLNVNPVGLNETIDAVRNAVEAFEEAARSLPVFGEEQVSDNDESYNSEEEEEEAFDNREQETFDDDGMFFKMDNDDDDCAALEPFEGVIDLAEVIGQAVPPILDSRTPFSSDVRGIAAASRFSHF